MVETLLGGLLGGIFRLVPEVIKYFNSKNEMKHELDMQKEAYNFQKLKGDQRIDEISMQGQSDFNVAGLEALKEAIRTTQIEFKPTGIKWVDVMLAIVVFLNHSVRPVITYWFFTLYLAAKLAIFYSAVNAGVVWHDAVVLAWTEADQALWAGIINFWFLSRVFEKVQTRGSM